MDRTQDRQLIAGACQARRTKTAVQELAERYGSRIYQLAMRHMKNREDAEEVTQDVLMKVYRKVDAFRGDAALSSWIYRITFNTAMSRLRSTARRAPPSRSATRGRRRHEAGEQVRTPKRAGRLVAHAGRGAAARAAARGGRSGDRRAAGDLPRAGRAAGHQGLTTEEASSRLKLKDQTLKSRLHRGRLMLRERLQAFTHRPGAASPTPLLLTARATAHG